MKLVAGWIVLMAVNIVAGTMAGVRYDEFLLGRDAVKDPVYSAAINHWYVIAALLTAGVVLWNQLLANRILIPIMASCWTLWSIEVLYRLPSGKWGPPGTPAEAVPEIKFWFALSSIALGIVTQIAAAEMAKRAMEHL